MDIVWLEEEGWTVAVTAETIERGQNCNVQVVEWNDGVPFIEATLREIRPDLLIIHPGTLVPRREAARVAKLAKELGAKVILVGASAVLFEMADGFMEKPLGPDKVTATIAGVMAFE